ncbi:MAG: hypothetical protein ACRC7I_10250, partial [Selenomonadaceae bacterium]
MDKETFKILKTIFNNDRRMHETDHRAPLVNGTPENKISYDYLKDNGFLTLDKNGMIHTTVAGNEYVENHFWNMINRYLSIVAIIISILAL